ncbi:MAG: HAD hydrolase family protein [Paludibacteraceae bacterium]|nr:HAD hydrolase family protein [Paludibacteraceae bacterium]
MKDIRLFLTDVDGCLTDGGMYYTADGSELKKFCVYDGMGIVRMRQKGIRCGILTSENTSIVLHRARKLCLDYLYMGVGRVADKAVVHRYSPATAEEVSLPAQSKKTAAETIAKELGVSLEQVCYVGDDVNDIDLLEAVGMAACPKNAVPQVKNIPGILHLQCNGGEGAIREVSELILNE